MQLALSVMKKESPKHRAAFVSWLRLGTISTVLENLPLQAAADNRARVRLNG